MDIALDPAPSNVKQALAALRGIGLVADTDSVEDILAQGGVTATNRLSVDLLTALPVGDFAQLWRRRKEVRYRTICTKAVEKSDQVRLLRSVGRRKDVEDADYLESLR